LILLFKKLFARVVFLWITSPLSDRFSALISVFDPMLVSRVCIWCKLNAMAVYNYL